MDSLPRNSSKVFFPTWAYSTVWYGRGLQAEPWVIVHQVRKDTMVDATLAQLETKLRQDAHSTRDRKQNSCNFYALCTPRSTPWPQLTLNR